MAKPKGKTPTLLAQSTGKPIVYHCKQKTKCSRCKGNISAGESGFHIPKMQNGFSNNKPFCLSCFSLTLEQTKKDIDELENTLKELQSA